MATIGAAFIDPSPTLIWNAGASPLVGIYAVRPSGALYKSEFFAVMPPAPVASALGRGGYPPRGVH